jgi:DnaJ family protein A protein 1
MHSDKNPNEEKSLNRFLKLMKFSLMPRKGNYMTKENRKLRGAADGSFGSPMDIFDKFFWKRKDAEKRTGKNIVHQLSVILDVYNGAIRKMALQKNVICDKWLRWRKRQWSAVPTAEVLECK